MVGSGSCPKWSGSEKLQNINIKAKKMHVEHCCGSGSAFNLPSGSGFGVRIILRIFSSSSLFAYNNMQMIKVFSCKKKYRKYRILAFAFCSPQLTKFMDPDPH
jgi:hypothetical protein